MVTNGNPVVRSDNKKITSKKIKKIINVIYGSNHRYIKPVVLPHWANAYCVCLIKKIKEKKIMKNKNII